MPIEESPVRISLFMSYRGNFVSQTWVKLAADLLHRKFSVYDYRESPETAPDLPDGMRKRIAGSDVFIALLSKDYLDNPLTRGELEAAIELSTGFRSGSLRCGQQNPIIYILACDSVAEDWCTKNHPSFTFFALEQYDFRSDPPLPLKPQLWDVWVEAIQDRLKRATESKVVVHNIDKPTRLVILGRPESSFEPAVSAQCQQLVRALGTEFPLDVIADGWYDKRDRTGADAARAVLNGGPRSLLIQVCDDVVWADNRVEDDKPGDDLRRKLQRSGLEAADAVETLKRTWLWLPQNGGTAPASTSPEPAPTITERDINAAKPVFGSSTALRLATLIQVRLRTSTLRLEAEEGIGDDIGSALNQGLKSYLDPMLFELVEPENLPAALRLAVQTGAPILVAIHDRKVDEFAPDKLAAIQSRAYQFDALIRRVVTESAVAPKIARAIFLVRNAAITAGNALITDDTWVLIPVDEKYKVPPDRLKSIQKRLGLPERP